MSQVSECCISGHLHDGTPKGAVSVIEGMKCYIATPESGNKEKAIFFITDFFGYALPNAQLLADEYAANGFYVYVPDLFDGDTIPVSILSRLLPTKQQEAQKTVAQNAADAAAAGAAVGPWLTKHPEAVVMPRIQKFLSYIRSQPEHKKVAAVGSCWGARYAILLTHPEADPYVDCAVGHHPSFVKIPGEIEKIAKPVAIEVGDADTIFVQKDIEITKEIFKNKKDCEIEVYEDQVHGFTIRGDLSVDKDKKAKEKAVQRCVSFINKHV